MKASKSYRKPLNNKTQLKSHIGKGKIFDILRLTLVTINYVMTKTSSSNFSLKYPDILKGKIWQSPMN